MTGTCALHLGLSTLETRCSDNLDFHDLAVWQLRAALEAAYRAGLAAAKNRARIFALLGLRVPEPDLDCACAGLHSAEPLVRARAVELLDNLLGRGARRALIPLLETHANGASRSPVQGSKLGACTCT